MISAFLLTTWSMKPGVLVREAVVVLAPHVRREQVVERGDRPPPRDVARHLQPLRVLVEHRVDDVDEGLVAVEEAVPAGEQVALEPALAEVLATAPRSRGRPARGGRRWARARRPTRGRSPRRRPRAGSTPSRPGRRCGTSSGLRRDDVAEERAEHARRLARASCAGVGHVDRVVAEVRQVEVAQQRARRSRAGSRPCGARPRGASAASSATQRAVLVEQLLGPVAPQPRLELGEVLGVRRASSASGTWCERNVPSAGRPSTSFGPVQPFGVRSTIIGQRGRSVRRPRAPRAGSRDLVEHLVERRGHQLVHRLGLVALDE